MGEVVGWHAILKDVQCYVQNVTDFYCVCIIRHHEIYYSKNTCNTIILNAAPLFLTFVRVIISYMELLLFNYFICSLHLLYVYLNSSYIYRWYQRYQRSDTYCYNTKDRTLIAVHAYDRQVLNYVCWQLQALALAF